MKRPICDGFLLVCAYVCFMFKWFINRLWNIEILYIAFDKITRCWVHPVLCARYIRSICVILPYYAQCPPMLNGASISGVLYDVLLSQQRTIRLVCVIASAACVKLRLKLNGWCQPVAGRDSVSRLVNALISNTSVKCQCAHTYCRVPRFGDSFVCVRHIVLYIFEFVCFCVCLCEFERRIRTNGFLDMHSFGWTCRKCRKVDLWSSNTNGKYNEVCPNVC